MSNFLSNTTGLFPCKIHDTWETEETKLCNNPNGPTILEVKNIDLISKIKKFIVSNWNNVKDPENFPGPQPVSLERQIINKLLKFPYVVCEKTDGMRYILVCKIIDGTMSTFIVNRSFHIYSVPGSWSCVSVFDGTILDGEIIREKGGSYTYYPHDCIMRGGINYAKENFRKRYDHTKEISVLWRKSDAVNNVVGAFDIKFKTFYDFKNIQTLIDKNKEACHDIDGIIFTPVNLPVYTGTQHSLIKWKEPSKHTFDFQIVVKSQRIEYFLYDKMSLTKYKTISKRSSLGKKIVSILDELIVQEKMGSVSLENSASVDSNIVECVIEDNEYIPLKLRNDKNRPNSLRTVERTLVNIEENITTKELADLSKQITK